MERKSKFRRDKDYSVIIGCGRLGATIASSLSDMGKNVLIMDTKEDSFRKLSPSFAGQTMVGDATDYSVLKEANISQATVLIPVTHSDNTNIMISQIAKEIFNVETVIARLYDPERDVVYKEFGIETIYPAYLESSQVLKWYGGDGDDE
ncbi:MAG: TrkA family potassium uptake protein [Anaerovoracaceae bacterium]